MSVAQVIMGGSGSTGSSVLQRILNRHPEVMAGPEIGLFQFPFLYDDWNRYKQALPKENFFGVKSRAFARRNGAKLLDPYYGWTPSELQQLLARTQQFPDFVREFFARGMDRQRATLFVEKTPQNAQGFLRFLENFPQGRVVHTLRDPYETMASLRRRGFPAYVAAGHLVYQMAAAASARGHERYTEVWYEDLIGQPEQTVRQLCAFLRIEFVPAMMEPEATERREAVQMFGWRAAETEAIRPVDLHKFDRLDDRAQREIIAALQVYEIPERYAVRWNIACRNFKDLCTEIGFRHRTTEIEPFLKQFRRERRYDWWLRSYRLHPTGWWNYPGEIRVRSGS